MTGLRWSTTCRTRRRCRALFLTSQLPRHQDWYFQVQYIDGAENWHEVTIPMLDGLYLLNLLRTAEEEQHLGLWNRR